jgi:hypothetical protein
MRRDEAPKSAVVGDDLRRLAHLGQLAEAVTIRRPGVKIPLSIKNMATEQPATETVVGERERRGVLPLFPRIDPQFLR